MMILRLLFIGIFFANSSVVFADNNVIIYRSYTEFRQEYVGKPISEILNILGDKYTTYEIKIPLNRDELKVAYRSRSREKYKSGLAYSYTWNTIEDLPVKIDFKKRGDKSSYYADKIIVGSYNNYITEIWVEHDKEFISEKEIERRRIAEEKAKEKEKREEEELKIEIAEQEKIKEANERKKQERENKIQENKRIKEAEVRRIEGIKEKNKYTYSDFKKEFLGKSRQYAMEKLGKPDSVRQNYETNDPTGIYKWGNPFQTNKYFYNYISIVDPVTSKYVVSFEMYFDKNGITNYIKFDFDSR